MTSPQHYYPTTAARKSLALRFGLAYSDQMQDWEWEVADKSRFFDFLAAYQDAGTTDEERYSLMEILIQCVDDDLRHENQTTAWPLVESLLLQNPKLHRTTVLYWSCGNEKSPEYCFPATPLIRSVRDAIT